MKERGRERMARVDFDDNIVKTFSWSVVRVYHHRGDKIDHCFMCVASWSPLRTTENLNNDRKSLPPYRSIKVRSVSGIRAN